jgi:hypothetical protein
MNFKFDCIIPVAGKDCPLLKNLISLVFKNLAPEKLYIITKAPFFFYFRNLDPIIGKNVVLINEDELLSNVNYNTIARYLDKVGLNAGTRGWYFQQFLKMGFALSEYANKYYLTFDADTYPVKPLVFFNENGLPYFSMKEENHLPYFQTLEKLLSLKKSTKQSFISENMLIDVEKMKSLISEIEQSAVPGENWCEKIINAMPANEINAFSEFETYGTYVLNRYPDTYEMRTLNTFRRAGKKYSRFISPDRLEKKASAYDIVTLEYRNSPNNLMGLYLRIYKKMLLFKNAKLASSYSKDIENQNNSLLL